MANLNLNKDILGGRLTADPELRKTAQDTSVTTFTIAVNRRFNKNNDGQPSADFITCVAWRQTAEFITQYFHKGSSICVVGSIQTRNWIDANTQQKRYATEVVVDEANFVDSKSENPGATTAYTAPPQYSTPAPSVDAAAQFEELSSDDDLPF